MYVVVWDATHARAAVALPYLQYVQSLKRLIIRMQPTIAAHLSADGKEKEREAYCLDFYKPQGMSRILQLRNCVMYRFLRKCKQIILLLDINAQLLS
jgi:hypothetical protein